MTAATEHKLPSSDGTPLFVRDWCTDGEADPQGLVLVVHGVGEHCGRYEHLAQALLAGGYVVRGFDHRGHGLSGGLRGHVDGFHHYTRDLRTVLDDFRAAHGDAVPCFLLGHSMGGLIVLQFLQEHPDAGVSGAILSNPCLEVAVDPPALKVGAARLLAKIVPQLRLDNELDTSLLCRDEEAVRAYEQDPLVHRKVSTRWYTSLLAAMEQVNSGGLAPTLATLWLIGARDAICAPAGSRQFAAQLSADITTLREWPEALHEVHNGPDKSEYLVAVRTWLDARTAGDSDAA
jgi:alpha-beta hydrolase superfamily lysophospholipase